MEVSVQLINWRVVEKSGTKRIAGEYKLMAGATEVATSSFNDDSYKATTVIFPTTLMVEAEALELKIREALNAHFGVGKE